MRKRCLGFRHQVFQGQRSTRGNLERVRKTRTQQVGNHLDMMSIDELKTAHIKRDVNSKLPVFDAHSENNSCHPTMVKGQALDRVSKTHSHQGRKCIKMEPIDEFENPHIKRDVNSRLPVLDVHSENDNCHLTITRGRALLAQMIKFCLDEGVFRFFIIHGTNSKRGGRKTWLQFLKKFFKNAIQVAWKKNKGVSVVYLNKLDKSRISELVQGACS